MKVKSLFIVGVLFSLNTTLNMAQARTDGLHDFVFNVHVPKNTCDIIIEGTSNNTVDFGNIPISKFKSDVPEGKVKLPFNVKLQNCKTTNFQGAYIKLSGSYSEENNGFLDDNGKSFAVRISNKDNATPSDTDFFTEQNNKMWTGINSTNMNRTYYAYVMCKTGASECAGNENVGKFKATLTLTFIAD
ncbi:type 1 fimbrial protein [Providencia stuartii]|uniref:Fimbrial protein n=1 Tax=Providencia stuartii TaxID=588 RepID=A0AAJ1JGD3_PROST|nr:MULTISPECIES: fimbrial protein [Providencia]AMG68092.1 type 1 fimbrial protein [Providencia stuartii]EMA3642333.1 type 1 fimbrial protein [Providencia stuartii]MBW3101467.1 type 1 fimbrial protein [Providencia stuartii]MCB5218344.1 type 1 fimbrial protein [Providencia stuartii]MDE5308364.1 fimbrial protein [Providencia stuartii]